MRISYNYIKIDTRQVIKILTGPQVFFHAVNGYKKELSPVKDGTCRLCGGPLVGSAELFRKYNWVNWNNEHMAKDRSSSYICLPCIESRGFRGYQNKAKKGFVASLSEGFRPFETIDDAVNVLYNLPEPPFTLAFMAKFTNVPMIPYLIANTNNKKIHILVCFSTGREMLVRADNKKGYKVIKPFAQEVFDLFVAPEELIEKVNFCKENKEEIKNTLAFRETCMSDPEWATAAWLAGFKNNEIYKYVKKEEKAYEKN